MKPVVTHHIDIDQAPLAYKEFDKRDGLVKAVIRSPMHGA